MIAFCIITFCDFFYYLDILYILLIIFPKNNGQSDAYGLLLNITSLEIGRRYYKPFSFVPVYNL